MLSTSASHRGQLESISTRGTESQRQNSSDVDPGTDLTEDKTIPECMLTFTRRVESLQLRLQRPIEEHTFQTRRGPGGHARLVNPIENSWNGRDVVRLEGLQIFKKSEGISCAETDAATAG